MSNLKNRPPNGPGSSPEDGGAYKGAGSHVTHSIEDLRNVVIATALRIEDAKKATAKLTELATSGYMAKYAAAMMALDRKIQSLKAKLVAVEAELTETKTELNKTPERLSASQANRGREEGDLIEESFWEWQFRHQVEAVFLVVTLLAAVAASLLTAHANLVGTGLPVFTDNGGLLAWTMASLAPLSGLAIKTIYEQLPSRWMRGVFQIAVITAMVISIGLWGLLYASTYHGLSPDTSVADLFEDPSFWDGFRDTAFIFVSLSTEVLIGTVLALRLTIIAGCYSPDYSHDNPDHARLTKKETTLQARLDELGDTLAELEGQRAEYDHSLQLQIHFWTLAHDGRRGSSDTPIL